MISVFGFDALQDALMTGERCAQETDQAVKTVGRRRHDAPVVGSRAGAPYGTLPRDVLVRRLVGVPLAMVMAPGGYGKSTLASLVLAAQECTVVRVEIGDDQVDAHSLTRRLSRALRRSGLSDAAAVLRSGGELIDDLLLVLESTEEVQFVFDDVERMLDDAAGWLADLCRGLEPRHRVLLLGRAAPAALLSLRFDVRLGEDELRLTRAEVTALCDLVVPGMPRDAVASVYDVSAGWAAAAELAARTRNEDMPVRGLTGGADADAYARVLRVLVEGQLQQLSPRDASSLVQLAHLPLLDAGLIETVGTPGLERRLRNGGVALRDRGDGWSVLPGPVAEHLRRTRPLEPMFATVAADAYADRGEMILGLRLLLRAGLDADVARRISGSAAPLGREDPSEVDALISALEQQAVLADPYVLVVQARALRVLGLQARRIEALELAVHTAASAGDEVLSRAARAEQADDLAAYEDPSAEDMARTVLESAGPGERSTRARAMAALGSALLRRAHLDRSLVVEAGRLLQHSATLLEEDGDTSAAARILMMAAMDLHHTVGDVSAALSDLDHAIALLPRGGRSRAVALALRAEVRLAGGDLDGAAIDSRAAIELGHLWRDHRALAYASWMQMEASSRGGRREETLSWAMEVRRHHGDWFEHTTGAIFLAEAALALDRVGVEDLDLWRQARERGVQAPVALAMAEAAAAARAGSTTEGRVAARALEELHESLQPRDEWWALFLRAAVEQSTGNLVGASALLTRARAAVPHPELLRSRDPELGRRLLPLLSSGAETPVSVRLTLFGQFEVRRGGERVEFRGRPAQVVQLLALRGGRALVEQLVEDLWPEEAPGAGRQRLRNVLARVRSALGNVIVRDTASLVLDEDVECDLHRYRHLAETAIRTADPEAAREALALHRGPLLADDPYVAWAQTDRDDAAAMSLRLLDMLADQAVDTGEVDEAVRLLHRATEVDRYDTERAVRAAGILLAAGRRGAALAAADRAESNLRDLGVAVPPAIEAIRRRARA